MSSVLSPERISKVEMMIRSFAWFRRRIRSRRALSLVSRSMTRSLPGESWRKSSAETEERVASLTVAYWENGRTAPAIR